MHLRDLAPAPDTPGPFVTAHVGAGSAVVQAADRDDATSPVPHVAAQPGTSRTDVEALGATSSTEGPMLDVLLRAAPATGADVHLVPHQSEQSPHSGLGALLRSADSDV